MPVVMVIPIRPVVGIAIIWPIIRVVTSIAIIGGGVIGRKTE
jgi:hypothetical protein